MEPDPANTPSDAAGETVDESADKTADKTADETADETAADHSRSGGNIAESVARAEEQRPPDEVHHPTEDSAAGTAPVEQHAADPEMKQGREQ